MQLSDVGYASLWRLHGGCLVVVRCGMVGLVVRLAYPYASLWRRYGGSGDVVKMGYASLCRVGPTCPFQRDAV